MCAADLVSQLTIRRLSRNYRNREENNKQQLFIEKKIEINHFGLCVRYTYMHM